MRQRVIYIVAHGVATAYIKLSLLRSPSRRIIPIHIFHKLPTRSSPALNPARQNNTLHLSIALLSDVVPEPPSRAGPPSPA